MSRFRAGYTPFASRASGARTRVAASLGARRSAIAAKRYGGLNATPLPSGYTPVSARGWKNNGVELKFADGEATSVIVGDNSGPNYCLNGTSVGDDISNRDGRQITNKYIEFRYNVTQRTSTKNTVGYPITMDIWWDKSPNSAGLAAMTDIYTANGSRSALDALSYSNLSNRHRFQLLKSITVMTADVNLGNVGSVPAGGTVSFAGNGAGNAHHRRFTLPLRNLITTYSGTTNSAASIATGMLVLAFRGNGDTSTATVEYGYQVDFSYRLRWVG